METGAPIPTTSHLHCLASAKKDEEVEEVKKKRKKKKKEKEEEKRWRRWDVMQGGTAYNQTQGRLDQRKMMVPLRHSGAQRQSFGNILLFLLLFEILKNEMWARGFFLFLLRGVKLRVRILNF